MGLHYKLADRSLKKSTQFVAVPRTRPKKHLTNILSFKAMKMFTAALAGPLVLALGVAGAMPAVNPENEAAADRCDYHGFVLARTHQTETAIQNFAAAIRANPSDWIPYVHRAQAYLEVGQWSKAVADCNAALRIKPTQINAYIARAVALYYLGRDVESLSDVAAVLKAGPSDSTLRTVLTVQEVIYAAPLQDSPEVVNGALAQVARAVEHARGNKAQARALNSRAWLFATSPIRRLRNGEQALRDALESCRLTAWKQPSNIDTLAAPYAENRDCLKAIAAQKQAIALLVDSRDDRKDYEARLSEYTRHQPHQQTAADRQATPPSVTR